MPRKQITRRHALLLGVAGLALLGGCTALSGGQLTDGDAVSDGVQNRYDALDGYTATVTQTVATERTRTSVTAQVTANTSSWAHVQYLSGPRGGTSQKLDLSGTDTVPTFSTGLQQAGAGAVPSYGALAERLVRTNDLSIDGVETLDGHRTAVISLVPESSSAERVSVERRIWVDVDRQIPLRIETTWTHPDGRTVTEIVRYTDVTLYENQSVPTPDTQRTTPKSVVVGA